MRSRAAAVVGAAALFITLTHMAHAQVIKPARDLTRIKAEGVELTLLNTVIDPNNAHPIEMIGFFVSNAKGPATQVPFEIDTAYEPVLTMKSGADCAISAVRIVLRGTHLRVAYAQRKGDWNDKKPGRLTLFELDKNSDGLPGTPDLYFKKLKSVDTKRSYCDMNTALDQESTLYN